MRKPIRLKIGFLRFLVKPLLILLLTGVMIFDVQGQTGNIDVSCVCLSNQTFPGNGQFEATLSVTGGAPNVPWYIADGEVVGLYSSTSFAPPTNPEAFATGPGGFTMTESPSGSGDFLMTGIHVDGLGFDITLTNGGLLATDSIQLVLPAGSCSYPVTEILGDGFVCEEDYLSYQITHNFGSSYSWSLGSGGTIIGFTSGSSINVQWGADDPGPHSIRVEESAANGCNVVDLLPVTIEDTIALACNNSVQVSLNVDCEGELTADMFLEDPQYENDSYDILIQTLDGQPIPGNQINSSHIGEQLMVTVIHSCSSNSCWSTMTVEDKIDPQLECVVDTVRCDDSFAPEAIGFPVDYPLLSPPVKVGPREYEVQGLDLCGPLNLVYRDDTLENDCFHEFASFVVRRWDATDGAGNTSVCYDTIKTTRTGLADMVYPPNYDGTTGNNPALNACDPWPKLWNGHPSPSFTGSPSGPLCGNLSIDYTDIHLAICGENSFKVIRKWFLMDMCTSEVFDTNQIIAVMDNAPPVVTVSADVEVTTDSYECSATVDLPQPTVLFECNSWSYTVGYKLADEFGNPPPASDPYITDSRVRNNPDGSYTLLNMPLGQTWIKYVITDACNNRTESFFEVKVIDGLPPVAVCDQHVVVSLNDDGKGYVAAQSFDDGSWDNCTEVTFQVRRGANDCGFPANQYRDGLEFCCEDIGEEIMVELLVTDESGFTNSCMSFVEVQDKREPSIYCPPNITVSCDFFISDFSIFGTVVTDPSLAKPIVINDPGNPHTQGDHTWGYDGVASDNCNLDVEIVFEHADIDECGTGSIIRVFEVSDGFNNTQRCTQTITVTDFDPFYINSNNPNDSRDDVIWPKDYVLYGCLDGDTAPEALPYGHQEPVLLEDNCSLVAFDYDDVVFQYVDEYCYKIIRTWHVIDWCQFDQANPYGAGSWTYNQLIMVVDDETPQFISGCDESTLINQINDNGCTANITLSAEATDNCTAPGDLKYWYELDENSDGSIDKTGNGNSVSGVYSYGVHKIHWYVEDECNNITECVRTFEVDDQKKPTPICYDGIVTVPMPTTGTVEIAAKSFNICNGCESGSYDNCTPQDQLRYSFSQDVNDKVRTFSCADIENGVIDTIDIQMWVTDLAGNQEFCNTHLILQDNQNVCPDPAPLYFDVAGIVSTPENYPMPSVSVMIEGDNPEYPRYTNTNNNGLYAFGDVEADNEYQISVSSNENPMGGISTLDLVLIQKHLLGLKTLNDPYDIIAADINASSSISAADLLDLRKLILGIYEELPNNDSWVFVDDEEGFENPNHPFPLNDIKDLPALRYHSLHNDFKAIKVGDVNNSMSFTAEHDLDTRTSHNATIYTDEKEFKVGEKVNTEFFLSDVSELEGMQFTLYFDKELLQFEGLESGELNINSNNYSLSNVNESYVTFSWSNGTGVKVEGDEPLFILNFKAIKNSRLTDGINISSKLLSAELYSGMENSNEIHTRGIELKFNNAPDQDEMILYQNSPNPFTDITRIAFYIPLQTDAILSVYDLNGKLLMEQTKEAFKGYGEFTIANEDKTFTPGLYHYKLKAGAEVKSGKMIMIR